MQEKILHYIWQQQLFSKKNLQTHTGQTLTILSPGYLNPNEGPDFLNATIQINNQTHYGNIEIHHTTDDWQKHKHHQNNHYKNVILHIVWQTPNTDQTPENIPTFCLAQYIQPNILAHYHELMTQQHPIPCHKHLSPAQIPQWKQMLKKALLQRLNNKHNFIETLLKNTKNNSNTTTYHLLAYAFGFNINSQAFLTLSHKVPYHIIQQQKNNLAHIEALLFGQAGLLNNTNTTPYIKTLQTHHQKLTKKYKLPPPMPTTTWKKSRIRPANTPTLRIAQMAQFLYKQQNLFTYFLNTPYTKIKQKLSKNPSPYWKTHYHFGKKANKKIPSIGTQSINTIIINTLIPLLITYGKIHNENFHINHALALLQKTPPEKNTITKYWTSLQLPIKNAFDSQGSISLYKNYCAKKQCLKCFIGINILKKQQPTLNLPAQKAPPQNHDHQNTQDPQPAHPTPHT